ncbi:MAG: hypothetical protein V3U60_06950, partial [Gammaproteobacteria bacterium]
MIGTAGASLGKWARKVYANDADPALDVVQEGSGLSIRFKGHIEPSDDNSYDIGSAGKTIRNIHVTTIVVGGSVTGDWNPSADGTYDLGENSTPLEWEDLHLDGIAYIDTLYVEVAGRVNDDILFAWGTGDDIVALNRSTLLSADGLITNAIIGSPDHPGAAANSLIVSNITASGDILLLVNKGGNSLAAFWADGST